MLGMALGIETGASTLNLSSLTTGGYMTILIASIVFTSIMCAIIDPYSEYITWKENSNV